MRHTVTRGRRLLETCAVTVVLVLGIVLVWPNTQPQIGCENTQIFNTKYADWYYVSTYTLWNNSTKTIRPEDFAPGEAGLTLHPEDPNDVFYVRIRKQSNPDGFHVEWTEGMDRALISVGTLRPLDRAELVLYHHQPMEMTLENGLITQAEPATRMHREPPRVFAVPLAGFTLVLLVCMLWQMGFILLRRARGEKLSAEMPGWRVLVGREDKPFYEKISRSRLGGVAARHWPVSYFILWVLWYLLVFV